MLKLQQRARSGKPETASLERATPRLVFGLMVMDQVYASYGVVDCEVTFGDDGEHGLKSKHPDGDAADLATRFARKVQVNPNDLVIEARRRLGQDYDVILEDEGKPNEHIHIEYDRHNRKIRRRGE